jgi:hypothetical protein
MVLRSETKLCLTRGSCIDPKMEGGDDQWKGWTVVQPEDNFLLKCLHFSYNIAPKS